LQNAGSSALETLASQLEPVADREALMAALDALKAEPS
jgi:hypothetical protein